MISEATLAEVKRLIAERIWTPEQIAFRCGVAVGLVKRLMRKGSGGGGRGQ